jgi:Ser/Thr protein kinase RdoA (MazF antagonist)
MRRLVDRHADDWHSEVRPVLCHHDVNGGNVLLGPGDVPRVSGVVDFERTSWDDPMRDLALTVLHLRHEEPETIPALRDGYGPLDDEDSRRLHVHVALRAMAEHTWVVTDRPQGWRQSAERLDGLVEEHLAARA